jgi:hypothetical protein
VIVYGDSADTVAPHRLIRLVHSTIERLRRSTGRWDSDHWKNELLLACGGLTQSLLDWACDQTGADDDSEFVRYLETLMLFAARALRKPDPHADLQAIRAQCEGLPRFSLPSSVRVKRPEGYAFYAVYPELYSASARRHSRTSEKSWDLTIGIRSIGVSLGAVVAEEVGSLDFLTLRPRGHPFARELRVSQSLERRVRSRLCGGLVAIVDEGPGLSGSSFGAVADWLEWLGVAESHMRFFASHDDALSPQASVRHRARDARCGRIVTSFDEHILPHEFQDGLTHAIGSIQSVTDVSAGRWRSQVHAGATRASSNAARYLPAAPSQERRKFLIERRASAPCLAKFAGLGSFGRRQTARARVLGKLGFGPKVLGYCRGFTLLSWIDHALPLPFVRTDAVASCVASYLQFRADGPRAPTSAGASISRLFEMGRHNAAQALGGAAAALERYAALLEGFASETDRVWTDNRMHAWEWLVVPSGRLLKTDGVDHAASHDLIGAQDITWDIVAAGMELSLVPAELDPLFWRFRRTSAFVRFTADMYFAFQIGLWDMAAQSTTNAHDRALQLGMRNGYAAALSDSLRFALDFPSTAAVLAMRSSTAQLA